MATKRSSFFLAVLLIANPFMLLFYQNCSVVPTSHAKIHETPQKALKSPASEPKHLTYRN
jgi:hypothetical protein